jgi:two-component system sensor histidine kinase PilS (NtrC family)
LQGTIKTFNRAAEEITGFSLAQVVNQPLGSIFPELAPAFNAGVIKDQVKNRLEVLVRDNNKENIHLGCSISPLKNNKEKQIGSILIFQDLTEIKLMEENLEKSKRLALIGEMAAGLAHEMRNPLASITGSIQLLRQSLDLEDTDERLMQIILRGKDQLDGFVRDFLLLARPIPAIRESIAVNEIMEDVLENIRLSKDWRDTISVDCIFAEKMTAFANREQIRQVIYNLVLNAVQSMTEGGILSLEVHAKKQQDREGVEIRITDSGCGIEEKNLENIFEPFYTNKDKGTGLGLTIVGRIVDGYGGRIKIESRVNQGTSCILWLPGKTENIT